MKLLILADMDGFHWPHGRGHADVVISCGDIVDQLILEAADAYGCQTIFAVKGNHDSNTPFPSPIVDIHREVRKSGGQSFGGLNGSWKYKPRGYFLYDQQEASAFLSVFPDVDILVSHNSPRGIHDQEDEVHYGFEGLNAYILRAKPKLVVHGHQHMERESLLGETRIIGVYGHKLIEV